MRGGQRRHDPEGADVGCCVGCCVGAVSVLVSGGRTRIRCWKVLFVSVSLHLCFSVPLSFSLSVSISLCLYLSVSLSLSLSLSTAAPPSLNYRTTDRLNIAHVSIGRGDINRPWRGDEVTGCALWPYLVVSQPIREAYI